MPIYSQAQQGFMFANHPEVAKKMADRMKGKSVPGLGHRSKVHPLKGLPARSSKSGGRASSVRLAPSVRSGGRGRR